MDKYEEYMEKHNTSPADLKEVAWPACSATCVSVAVLGVCECEETCPDKFTDLMCGQENFKRAEAFDKWCEQGPFREEE